MGVRKWHRDDTAVSPVVGVTLLIVITVVLVAVILAMLNGAAGETPSQTEVDVQQSAFSFELSKNESYSTPHLDTTCYSGGYLDGSCNAGANDEYIADRLTVTYEGGKDIPAEDVRIRAAGAEVKILNESGYLEDYGNGEYHSNYTLSKVTDESTVSAGDEFVLVTNYGDWAVNSPPHTPGSLLREASIDVI